MDVDYSVCKCYDFDVWLPVSEYNRNNCKKKPPIFSELETRIAQSECWSYMVEFYASFERLAFLRASDSNNGDISWSLSRNGCWPMEALHIEFVNRSAGWVFYFDFCCGSWFGSFINKVQIQKTLNIDTGELELD